MAVPAGKHAALNLGPIHPGPGSHVPLNLGIDWNTDPPDPPDPPVGGLRMSAVFAWKQAPRRARSVRSSWGASPRVDVDCSLAWGRAAGVQRALSVAWDAAARYKRGAAVVWSAHHHQLRPGQAITWQGLPQVSARIDSAWASLGSTHASVEARWRHLQTMQAAWQAPFLSTLDVAHSSALVRWHHPFLTRRGWRIPWGKAARIPWVVLPPAPPEPPEEPQSPFPSGRYVGLNRGCPTSTVPGIVPLNLGLAACYAVRPQRRTYIVRNTLSVVRLPDRLAIEVDSVSIAASAEAWGHSIDMTISRPSDLALLKPTVDGPRLIDVANDSFVSAMHWAAGASAVVAALGIVIVLRWMPGRPVVAPDAAPVTDRELAGTA